MTARMRVLIYLFVATVIIASCSDQPTVVEPVPSELPPPRLAQAGCPSIEEVCDEAQPIVTAACPPDSSYRNDADYNKCRREAFKQATKKYKDCFTGEEMNAIRRCVFGTKQTISAKGGEDRFQDDAGRKNDSPR